MASIYADVGGGQWGTGSTWVGGNVPTAADDVFLDDTAGNVTINVNAACRSLNCSGYLGTLTHNAGVTLSIGDGTAGAGNVALKFYASMFYTKGNGATSAIAFVSTSGTTQTITTAGKTLGNTTFNGAGGSWQLTDNLATSSTAKITHTQGSFDAVTYNVQTGAVDSSGTSTRTLKLGTGTWTLLASTTNIVWSMNLTGLTFEGTNANIVITGGNNHTFNGAGLDYGKLSWVGTGTLTTLTITGSNAYGKSPTGLDLSCTSAAFVYFQSRATQSVSAECKLQGASGQTLTVLAETDTVQFVIQAETFNLAFVDTSSPDVLLLTDGAPIF